MLIKYGNFSYPENECELTITQKTQRGPFGAAVAIRRTWRIAGRLAGASQAELTTAIQALEAAQIDGYDLILYTDSGITESAHVLRSAGSIGGVKVEEVSYPEGRGAEYGTFRNFVTEYTALYAIGSSGLIDWQETLEFTGGGSVFNFTQTLQGPPVRNDVCEQTTYRAFQTGSAVAMGTWPNFPPPAFGAYFEHRERRIQSRGTPKYNDTGQSSFPINWSYEFESANPFGSGFPSGPQ